MLTIRFRPLLFCIALGLGFWQLGQAGYLHAKAVLAQQLIKQAWQQTLENLQQNKPWPWADTWPVGRLQVPAHDIDLYVLAGDNGRTLAFGPGHRFGSAQPGETGTTLISGHRDTHFRFLNKLKSDDEILFQGLNGQWQRYRVSSSTVVYESDGIADSSENALALVTCYPFDAILPGGPLRFVVFAVHSKKTLNSNREVFVKT